MKNLIKGVLALALTLSFMARDVKTAYAEDAAKITVDGSSTVYPMTEAVAEEYTKKTKGKVHVTVGISGTGGGFKKFVRGEIDISDASRPILKKEIDAAKENGIEYLELPVLFDALTVVINKKNTWASSMTVDELKKIWEPGSKVTKWNEVRQDWPNEKIILYGPGQDSGTFDYFTEAINGKSKASRSDYTASEDDNVLVQGVQGSEYALGYFGFSYYVANKDKVGAVAIQWDKNAVKEAVAPDLTNVLNGTYNPLSRPLFIYVNKKSLDRKEVKDFIEFYLENAVEIAKSVHYLPLSEEAYEKCMDRLQNKKCGTVYGGEMEVGVKVEDALAREPK